MAKIPKTLIKVKINNGHLKDYIGYSKLKEQRDPDDIYRLYVTFPEMGFRDFFPYSYITIIDRCYIAILKNRERNFKKDMPKMNDAIAEIWKIINDVDLEDLRYDNMANLEQQGYLNRIAI